MADKDLTTLIIFDVQEEDEGKVKTLLGPIVGGEDKISSVNVRTDSSKKKIVFVHFADTTDAAVAKAAIEGLTDKIDGLTNDKPQVDFADDKPKKSRGGSTTSAPSVGAADVAARLKADLTFLAAVKGKDGKDGRDGKDGMPGKTGSAGKDGPQGPQGPKGDTGCRGPEGPQGPQGPDGKDGKKAPLWGWLSAFIVALLTAAAVAIVLPLAHCGTDSDHERIEAKADQAVKVATEAKDAVQTLQNGLAQAVADGVKAGTADLRTDMADVRVRLGIGVTPPAPAPVPTVAPQPAPLLQAPMLPAPGVRAPVLGTAPDRPAPAAAPARSRDRLDRGDERDAEQDARDDRQDAAIAELQRELNVHRIAIEEHVSTEAGGQPHDQRVGDWFRQNAHQLGRGQ